MALLRLTFFDFYLSIALGFPVEINALGGSAFNFVNYISFAGLVVVMITCGRAISTSWSSLQQYAVLVLLYLINLGTAPYIDPSWVLYQLVFIAIAIVVHIYIIKIEDWNDRLFYRKTIWIYSLLMCLVVFCLAQILIQYSVSYYFEEFNDAFVHSLDDFGIMKQRYGYLLGFLLAYSLFMIKNRTAQGGLILIILLSGFGIRSFIIGMLGALLVFSLTNRRRLLLVSVFAAIIIYFVKDHYFDNIIYDTRFYSYANAYNIMTNFSFGVGLGGYPIYTEIFNRQIFADFYNLNAILDYVPIAPESDYVHLFGSLGLILGSIHLAVQARLMWVIVRLQKIARPFEKCLIFFFSFMMFFGLGEDSMFTIYYWIFFGLASGVVTILLQRQKKQVYG